MGVLILDHLPIKIKYSIIAIFLLSRSFSQQLKDTVQVKEWVAISKSYFNSSVYDSARYYNDKALDLAKKINNKKCLGSAYHLMARIELVESRYDLVITNEQIALKFRKEAGDSMGVSDSYNLMGKGFFGKGDYVQAVKNYSAAIRVSKNIDDKIGMAYAYISLGDFYSNTDNQPEALNYYYQSLKLQMEAGETVGVANCYNNIGVIHKNIGNKTEALKNFYSAMEIYGKIGNKLGLAYAYNNVGLVHQAQGNYKKAMTDYELGLKLATEINDKNGQGICLDNIGNIYTFTNKHKESVETFLKVIKLKEEIQDKRGLSVSLLNLACEYLSQKNYDKAEEYCLKSIVPARELHLIEYLTVIHLTMSNAYAGKKQFEKSLKEFKLYKELNDTLNNVGAIKRTEQARLNYEFSKKEAIERANQEKRDAVQKEELQKQKLIRNGSIAAFILAIFIVFFIFRSLQMNKRKNKIITEQKAEVEHQKHEIEHQKELVEEKQKEVMDSIHYAKRIQTALLASDSLLKNNLHEYFVLFKPKDVVSGDFYWATAQHNAFYLATADSTGHGVPGAFMSLLNISFLNEAINEKHLKNPNEILDHVRGRLIKALKDDGSQEGGKDGMDCILVSLDLKNKEMQYSAANNSFYIVRNHELISCAADKMPVGRSPRDGEPFTMQTINLQAGDIVYTLTDGFPDQFGGLRGKKYKYKQLEELILANCDKPLKEQKEIYNEDFERWKGNLEQVDDVLLIGIKIC